ncbi:MAG: DUF1616 domain-containing protein [Chloroflexi bacterium]|nr:DUF1616 domain-containing protein [Chloroflexota bacterium]
MKLRIKNELLLIDIFVVLLVVVAIFFPVPALRVVLGLPFFLFFPGYTLTVSLFPKKDSLGVIERVVLSFGLSIGVSAFILMILNATELGVNLYPVLISLSAFILLTSYIGWYRRHKILPEERYGVAIEVNLPSLEGQSRGRKVLFVFLIAVILVSLAAIGYVIASPRSEERFSEFYLLGRYGKVEYYPGRFTMEKGKVVAVEYGDEAGGVNTQRGEVTLVIINHEYQRSVYQIGVRLNARDIAVGLDGEDRTLIGPIRLEPDEKWERVISFAPLRAGDNQKVEFILYKDGVQYFQTPAYIWINVVELDSGQ